MVTILLTKVAQIFGDFLAILKKYHSLGKNYLGLFGLLFTPAFGHTAYNRDYSPI